MTDSESRRRAAERLLEDESLTADLTDDAARILLDWGLGQVENLSQEEPSRLASLRRSMRSINKQAGKALPEAQAERVRALLAEKVEQDTETEQVSRIGPDAEYYLEVEVDA